MKYVFLVIAGLFMSLAASAQQDQVTPAAPGVTYGKGATADNAISLPQLPAAFKGDSLYKGKVTGKVVEVCTKKGCFMRLSQDGKEPILVRFTDYAFFMPKNIVGKTVVVDGTAKVTETSVARQKHYAKDAGKTEQEIAAITEPKKAISIMADGVLVVN